MEPIAAAPFTGNQADDFMDAAIMGLSNTQEIVGGHFSMTPAPSPTHMSIGEVVRAVAEEAQKGRSQMPTLEVVPFSHVEYVEDESVDMIMGASTPTAPVFPLTESLYREFSATAPDGKAVRFDTEDSYTAMRLARLEQAMVAHTADGHGGGGPFRPIALSLPSYADGLVDCWQDGDMICCSMKISDDKGTEGIATAATPVEAHVDEVMGCVHRLGLPIDHVVGAALPHLVGMLGGGSLVPKLASVAPALLRRPEAKKGQIFVGRMSGGARASSAAMLALLQMAQQGDHRAIAEWNALASVARMHSRKLAKAMKKVQNVLEYGQKEMH